MLSRIDVVTVLVDVIEALVHVVLREIVQIRMNAITSLRDNGSSANVVYDNSLLSSRLVLVAELKSVEERFELWNSLSRLASSTSARRRRHVGILSFFRD